MLGDVIVPVQADRVHAVHWIWWNFTMLIKPKWEFQTWFLNTFAVIMLLAPESALYLRWLYRIQIVHTHTHNFYALLQRHAIMALVQFTQSHRHTTIYFPNVAAVQFHLIGNIISGVSFCFILIQFLTFDDDAATAAAASFFYLHRKNRKTNILPCEKQNSNVYRNKKCKQKYQGKYRRAPTTTTTNQSQICKALFAIPYGSFSLQFFHFSIVLCFFFVSCHSCVVDFRSLLFVLQFKYLNKNRVTI